MKKILFIISFILTAITANAQTDCNVIITSNFESQCVLTTEKEDALKENDGLMLACKESEVEYYATSSNATTYNWTVIGASNYTLINNGAGVRVNWSNGNTGQVKVQVITQDGSICEATRFITLIEKPQIASSSIPNYKWENGVKVIEICLGETVTFINESSTSNTDIVGHFWETSIYGNASSENYTLENIMQGTSVLHKIINNCGCEDEEKYEIRILEGQKLELSCYGTVCAGSEVTYEVLNSNCNKYNWFVEGGIIKSGQGNSKITIEWGNPQSGYGILGLDGSLCGEGYCPKPVSVKIPIITNNVEISGQTTACVGDAVVYSLPLWGSTEYTWTITPQQGVQQSNFANANETLILFTTPGVYYLTSTYECDFLECGPFTSQTKTIIVKEKLNINTERDNICKGQSATFTLNNNTITARWTIYTENGQQVYTTQSNTLTYTFQQTGKYRITASHSNYCNTAEYLLNVKTPPPAPTITEIPGGPITACINSSVLLQGTPQSPLYGLIWEPENTYGTPSEVSGNEVTINFGANLCNVNVYHYDKLLGCKSETPYIQQINLFQLAPVNIPSTINACAGSYINLMNNQVPNQSPDVLYEWKIVPENAATIVGGNHLNNNVNILVNIVPNLSQFSIKLIRRYCSELIEETTINVNVVTPPTQAQIPAINYNNPSCVDISVPFTLNPPASNNSYFTWVVDETTTYQGVGTINHTFGTAGVHQIELTYQPYQYCPSVSTTANINIIEIPYIELRNTTSLVHVFPINNFPEGSIYNFYWSFNGNSLPGYSVGGGSSPSTGNNSIPNMGNGRYCCTIVNTQTGCSKETCITLPGSIPPTTICDDLPISLTSNDICSSQRIKLHANNPLSNRQVIWRVYPSTAQINILSNDDVEINFTDVGYYTILGSVTWNGVCYEGEYNIIVSCILDLDLSYDCNTHEIVVKDNSKYIDPTNVGVRPCSITDGMQTNIINFPAGDISDPNINTVSIVKPIPTTSTYTNYNVTINHSSGCSKTEVITLYPVLPSLSISAPNQSCEETPILLTLNHGTSFNSIEKVNWNFGDGSSVEKNGNTVYHTFAVPNNSTSYTYNVSAQITDMNNCEYNSPTINITSNKNDFNDGELIFSGPQVCKGTAKPITFDKNTAVNHDWYEIIGSSKTPLNPPTTITPSTNLFHTGDYMVLATNNNGCKREAMKNAGFLNIPEAIISGKTEYCKNDEIELSADLGLADVTYNWNVTDPNGGFTNYTTPTISFIASTTGQYTIYLTTTKGQCSGSSMSTITVHSQSPAPTIGFGANSCIHTPPVILQSINANPPLLLHWNNGVYHSSADYYTAGYALAYYYDQYGCKSEEAKIVIPSAPDFDALLTGCYKRCSLPPTLGVYNLSRSTIAWNWLLNQNQIANGSGNYSMSPLYLPLNGFGTYNLDVSYNNNACNTTSPNLVIEQEDCPCNNLKIDKIVAQKSIQECRIIYTADVTICNSGHEACLDKLISKTDGINILNIDNFPLNLGSGECNTIRLTFEVLSPLTSNASFRIYDACNDCFIDFSIDIEVEILDCEEEMILEYIKLNPEFSSQTMAYFDFGIFFPNNPQAIFRVWSEPSQVLNYNFDQGGARIDGLAMFDRNLLEQLAERGDKVCFHVLMCKNNVIRECVVCIEAKKLLEIIRENGFKSSPIQDESEDEGNADQTNSPYLVPNPASSEVGIKGIEKDKIAEIMLLDITGKSIKKVTYTDNLDIKAISKGTYIIRVISTTNNVYYLKLIKN